MKVGLGHMGILAPMFWDYTLVEWIAAIEGYRNKHGISDVTSMSRSRFNHLMEKYPDGTRYAA